MTDLQAANKALALLGAAPVTSLDQDVQTARVMNLLFGTSRMAVLAEFPWSFALRMEALAPAPAGTDIPRGWRYAWEYPSAAAALYRVYGPGRDVKTDFVTADGFIFTNESDAWAEYTAMPEHVDDWPPLAAEAFVVRLASSAAASLGGSPQLAAALLQQYGQFVELAKGNSTNEERTPRPKATHYIDVRNY